MRTIIGFSALLSNYKEAHDAMGFFVDLDFINEKNFIANGRYYLSETRDEDDEMAEHEDKYKMWLDYQMFESIINNKLSHNHNATEDDLLEAVVYYLKEDDFLD